MLSAQDATRSQRCSATPRLLCCVWVAPQFCVSPLEAKHVSQRGAHSGGSSISCTSDAPVKATPASIQHPRKIDPEVLMTPGHQMGLLIQCDSPLCCSN